MTQVNSEYTGIALTNVTPIAATFLQQTTIAEQKEVLALDASSTPAFTGPTLTKAQAGAPTLLTVSNTDNSSTSSIARMQLTVGGANAGDAVWTASISGVADWAWGIDNDDNDAFCVSNNFNLGTNNVLKLTPGATHLYSTTVYFDGSLEHSSGNVLIYNSGSNGFMLSDYMGFGGISQGSFETNHVLMGPNNIFYQAKCYSWNTYSDARLKKDIIDFNTIIALQDVLSMRLRSYLWKEGQGDNVGGNIPKRQIGYVAQELAEVSPEACSYDEENIATSVDLGRASVKHTGAIQELYKIIIGLTERLSNAELLINQPQGA